MKEVKVEVKPNHEGIAIVEVRTGEAAKIPDMRSFNFSGNIDTVSEYLTKMKDMVKTEDCIIECDYDSKRITLSIDHDCEIKSVIQGNLTKTEELKRFEINAGKFYSSKNLIDLIKRNRLYFLNKDNKNILDKLMKLTFDKTISGKNFDDTKGNLSLSYDQAVKLNSEMHFILDIKIFKGFPAVHVPVEICFDISETGVTFWLESIELIEIEKTLSDKIINDELAKIDPRFVLIKIG